MLPTGERGYALIDFDVPRILPPRSDLAVRFLEYVRLHFHDIVPGVPVECEVDLFAGGHAHNPGLLPLLGVFAPGDLASRLPDPGFMIEAVSAWARARTDDEVRAIAAATEAPTWAELQRVAIHPARW